MSEMSAPYFVGNPTTCSEAVRLLHEILGSDWKEVLYDTAKDDLILRHFDLGPLIRNGFDIHHNRELITSCGEENADDASMVIIQTLWDDLHKNYTNLKKALHDNGTFVRKGSV